MKKEMEIKLYKLEVIPRKENIAEEWLEFLKQNKEAGEALLKKEKAYFEAYFKSIEEGTMYIYLFFSAEDVNFSNNKALHHGSSLDKKHFAYMKECVDLSKGDIMDCLFYLNNMEDFMK